MDFKSNMDVTEESTDQCVSVPQSAGNANLEQRGRKLSERYKTIRKENTSLCERMWSRAETQ